jgi:hypothetical protein
MTALIAHNAGKAALQNQYQLYRFMDVHGKIHTLGAGYFDFRFLFV